MARLLPLKLQFPNDLLPILSEQNKKPLVIEKNQEVIFELVPPLYLAEELEEKEQAKVLENVHFKMFLLNLNFNKKKTKTKGLLFVFKNQPRTTLLEKFDDFSKEKWQNYKGRQMEYDPVLYFDVEEDQKIILPEQKEGRFIVLKFIEVDNLCNISCEGSFTKELSSTAPSLFSRDLFTSLNDQSTSDVKIFIEDKVIYGHKVALFQSKYLQELCQKDEIHIKNIKYSLFVEILAYFYTGIITIKDDQISELASVAEKFKMESLKTYFSEYFVKTKCNEENVCTLLKNGLSGKYNFIDTKSLVEKCKDFIVKNTKKVFQSDDIVNMEEDMFLSILKEDTLEVEEFILMDSLYKWGKYRSNLDGKSIQDHTKNLIQYIRISQIDPVILVKTIRPWGIVPDKEYRKAVEYHAAPEYIAEEDLEKDPFYQGRQGGTRFVLELKTNPQASQFKLTKNNMCVERISGGGWNNCQVYSSKKITSKVYCEFTINFVNSDRSGYVIGVVEENDKDIQFSQGIGIGMSGNKYKTTGSTPSGNTGDKIGMLLDVPGKKVKFYKNGASMGIQGVLTKNAYYVCVHLYYAKDGFSLSFPSKIPNK